MKKITLFTALVLLTTSLFAGFIFDVGPNKPTYPISLVDPFSSITGLHYLIETKNDKATDILLFNRDTMEYEKYKYREYKDDSNKNLHLSVGANFSLLRFGWENLIEVDFVGAASLNSVFAAYGATDMVGIDGAYNFSGEVELFDMFTVKFGLQHYSGHWGDEIIMKVEEALAEDTDPNKPTNFDYVEYVRDNQWQLGIAYTGSDRFNVAASVTTPMLTTNVRPFLHVPDYSYRRGNDAKYVDLPAYQAELAERGLLGDNYHALIVQFEAQYRHPISKKVDLFAGANVKLHQDGITNQLLHKDKHDNTWEMEYTLIAGVELKNSIPGGYGMSIDVIFHEGRFPLMNLYYKHSQYVSVGFSVR